MEKCTRCGQLLPVHPSGFRGSRASSCRPPNLHGRVWGSFQPAVFTPGAEESRQQGIEIGPCLGPEVNSTCTLHFSVA